MNIENEIDQLISDREGGYTNDPDDRGGETKYGITKATANNFGYHGPMSKLSIQYAKLIYKSIYWMNPKIHKVAGQSDDIAEKLFDLGVLCGVEFAGQCLQRSLNLFNDRQRLYLDIKVDGMIGPRTLGALKEYLRHRGEIGELQMIKVLNGLQMSRMVDIVEANESQERFFYGWIAKRIFIGLG